MPGALFLKGVRLDAGGLRQPGSHPSWHRNSPEERPEQDRARWRWSECEDRREHCGPASRFSASAPVPKGAERVNCTQRKRKRMAVCEPSIYLIRSIEHCERIPRAKRRTGSSKVAIRPPLTHSTKGKVLEITW